MFHKRIVVRRFPALRHRCCDRNLKRSKGTRPREYPMSWEKNVECPAVPSPGASLSLCLSVCLLSSSLFHRLSLSTTKAALESPPLRSLILFTMSLRRIHGVFLIPPPLYISASLSISFIGYFEYRPLVLDVIRFCFTAARFLPVALSRSGHALPSFESKFCSYFRAQCSDLARFNTASIHTILEILWPYIRSSIQ